MLTSKDVKMPRTKTKKSCLWWSGLRGSCELCACVHRRRKGPCKHHLSPSPPRQPSQPEVPECDTYYKPLMTILLRHCKDLPRTLELGWKGTLPCHSAIGMEGPYWSPQGNIRAIKSPPNLPWETRHQPLCPKASCKGQAPRQILAWICMSECDRAGAHLDTCFRNPS